MVYFKYSLPSTGGEELIILEDHRQPLDQGTALTVHTPLIGSYAKSWVRFTTSTRLGMWSHEHFQGRSESVWSLRSSYHEVDRSSPPKESSDPILLPVLGDHIVKGEVKWGDTLQFVGGFQFFKGYWEWTEEVLSRCEHELKSAKIFDAVFASLFTYDYNSEIMKAFFEAWCPTTNTLLTSLGEVSISLWDLHTLSGLPLTGHLYDEVVPAYKELIGSDAKGVRYLHRSCRYLFYAYHLLRKSAKDQPPHVSIERWIQFWSKKPKKYVQPPPRKEKKSSRPKSTHNPPGDIGAPTKWNNVEDALFSRLGVDFDSRSETYLAAHLACWLCIFVLPTDNIHMIRPSTFKMASMMASGERVSLAVPVLASIYRGINKISRSLQPHQANSPFSIHFVYGWMAHYFKTHYQVLQGIAGPKMVSYSGEGAARNYNPSEARKRVHKGDYMSWTCNMIPRVKPFLYVDDGKDKETEKNYFLAIRSCYLSLRRSDHFVIEPYSPHRFGRQFGFYQDMPGILSEDIRKASLTDGLRHWRQCVMSESMSKVMFPPAPQSPKKFYTEDYKRWWAKAYGTYLEGNVASLINFELNKILLEDKECEAKDSLAHSSHENAPQTDELLKSKRKKNALPPSEESDSSHVERHWKRPKKDMQPSGPHDLGDRAASHSQTNDTFIKKLEKEIIDVDDREESQASHHSATKHLSTVATPLPTTVMQNDTLKMNETIKETCNGACSVFVGEKFLHNHKKDFLRKLWGELCVRIINTSIDSISSMQEDVQLILDSMKSISDFDISCIEGLLKVLFSRATAYDAARSLSFETASKEILPRQLNEAKGRLHITQTKKHEETLRIQAINDDLEKVKKEYAALKARMESLTSSLEQQRELLCRTQAEVRDVEEEIAVIENTSPLSDVVMEDLKASAKYLEDAKEDLRDLDPFA